MWSYFEFLQKLVSIGHLGFLFSAQFSHSVMSDSLRPHHSLTRQASLSIANSQSLLKVMFIQSVMLPNYLILCRPLLLPTSIFPSIRVFSSESILHMRQPKYLSFSFNISPSNGHSGLISFRMDWWDLLAVERTFKSLLQTTVQKHQFFSAQLSLQPKSHIHT